MNKFFIFSSCFIFLLVRLSAQNSSWAIDYSYFFDNTEFAGSSLTVPQTMSGMHVTPKLNVNFEPNHSLITGIDVLMLAGASKRFQEFMPVAYYQLKTKNQKLLVGSFPRTESISNYSDFLFQDSINYFRPNLHGIYWNIGNNKKFINLWLDWTGKQTETDKETFFSGISGYHEFTSGLFIDFQSYLFHFAKTKTSLPDEHVCDNLQAIFSAGYTTNKLAIDNQFQISVGIFAGYERERNVPDALYTPLGIVLQLDFERKFWGINSKLYTGEPRMRMYSKFSNNLYWGNPWLQSDFYLENKLYIKIINNKYVQGKIAYQLHVSENKVFHEQVFTLNASIDKLLFSSK